MFDEKYAQDFPLFGWLHLLILGLGAASLVGVYYARGFLSRPLVGKVFRYTVATLLVVLEVAYQLWLQSLGEFRWNNAIPLGLCHIMNWATAIALFFDLDRVFRVILPWAFAGAILSWVVVEMGTPSSYAFPHFRFFHYFGNHWLFLVGNLYYLWTGRFSFRYKDLLKSSAWLMGVALVVLGIDLATSANHMFLREWPAELGFVNQWLPFPLNTLALMLGIFILLNIFYLIFVIGRSWTSEAPRKAAQPQDPEGGHALTSHFTD